AFVAIIESVSKALEYDIGEAVVHAEKVAASDVLEDGQTGMAKLTARGEKTLDTLLDHMTTLQLSLELLANIFSENLPEETEWVEMGDAEDGDEIIEEDDNDIPMDDELMAVIAEESTAANDDVNGGSGSGSGATNGAAEKFALITNHDIFAKVLRLAGCNAPAIPSPSLAYPFVSALSMVRLRAFGSLQNLLTAAATGSNAEWFVGNWNEVLRIWGWLFETAHVAAAAESLSAKLDIIDAATATPDQINALISTCSLPGCPEALQVRCISLLGILGKTQGNIESNRHIGSFIMNVITNGNGTTSPLDVIAEALNAIYDIYADENFDYDLPVFIQGGFLERLRGVYLSLKGRVKTVDKRKMREVRDRADEAMLNLRAFIQYKEKEMVRS
ncbi:hypothetical protein HDU76_003776, partial [Blyttiomyces sp. JEL0837]